MTCPRTELARRPGWQAAIEVNPDGNLVRAAVAQLPDRDRAMIYQSYYLGRSTTQIAAELMIDDDLVKHGLHRALHALRVALQKCDGHHAEALIRRQGGAFS